MGSKGLGLMVTLQLYKQNLDSFLDRNCKGKVTLFNVGSSFSYETGINGSQWHALYPLASVSAPFYGVFKAMATWIKGKSKQTLKSLKIEPQTSRSESRALAN